MKKKFILIVLSIVIFKELYSQGYYFVEIENLHPVISINDERVISEFNKHLLNSKLNVNPNINITTIFSKNINQFYGKGTRYKIESNSRILRSIVPYIVDDKVNIQHVNKEGTGKIIHTSIDSIFYEIMNSHQSHVESKIMLYCSYKIEQLGYKTSPNENIYIASKYNENNNNIPNLIFPESFKYIIDSLSANVLTESIDSKFTKVTCTSLQSFRKSFYVVLISYGQKGRTGYLYVIDDSGKIVAEDINNYNYIIGKTDVDSDRIQELVLFYGDGFGGGVEIMIIDNWSSEKITLLSRLRYGTVRD